MANTKITADNLDTLTTLTVDDITLDGSTISDAGDLTLDIGGDLTIDVDGADIKFADGGTEFADHFLDGSDYKIQTTISNGDFIIVGNDGGSAINALTLDMSDAGKATFNAGGSFGGALTGTSATFTPSSGENFVITRDGAGPFIGNSSNHELRIITNNTERMRFSTTGRVGIGANSPSALLELEHSSDAEIDLDCTGGRRFRIASTAANALIFSDKTGSAERIRVDSSGKVGIGTQSPDGLLHISSGNSGDAIVIIQADEDNNEEGDNPQLWFKADGDITEAAIRQADNKLEIISNVSVSGGISFLTGTSDNTGTTDPGTGATEKMKISADGKVGIGTQSPARELDVQAASGWGEIALRGASGSGASLEFYTTSTKRAEIFTDTEDIVFRNTASNTERMRINSAGIVTRPNQPAFHAYGPTSGTSGAYIVYQNATVNTGGHYSTSTGKFTAPVAGVYFLYWSAIGNDNADVYRYYLRVNQSSTISNTANDIHLRIDTLATGNEYGTNGSRNQILTLAANDEVQIYFQADSGANTYVNNDYVNFGGYLIG